MTGVTGVTGVTGPAGSGGFSFTKITGDYTNATTGLTDITDLRFAVSANTDYVFQFVIVCSNSGSNYGIRFALTCPASPTWFSYRVDAPNASDGTSAAFIGWGTASGDSIDATAVPSANDLYIGMIWGILKNGSNSGYVQAQAKSENASGTVTVKAGSFAMYHADATS